MHHILRLEHDAAARRNDDVTPGGDVSDDLSFNRAKVLFSPAGKDLRHRGTLAGFDPERTTESFGISPDGARLTIASWEQLFSLMLAERVPGVLPPAGPRRAN